MLSFSNPSFVDKRLLNDAAKGLLAMVNEIIKHANNSIPPPVLEFKNSLKLRRLISLAMGTKILKIVGFNRIKGHKLVKKEEKSPSLQRGCIG